MDGDVLGSGVKQFRYEGLGEPEGFVFEAALDAGAAVFGLVEEDGGVRGWIVGHGWRSSDMGWEYCGER